MESAAHGCATITSKNGGLPETFYNELFLKDITSKDIFDSIENLILNKKKKIKIQKKNYLNLNIN